MRRRPRERKPREYFLSIFLGSHVVVCPPPRVRLFHPPPKAGLTSQDRRRQDKKQEEENCVFFSFSPPSSVSLGFVSRWCLREALCEKDG